LLCETFAFLANLLKSLFSVIDIHCHILPEVDDGPKTWDVSQDMCRLALADGIEHIVATPHANSRYHYDRPYLTSLLGNLRQLVGPKPVLSLGCDFHLSYENLEDALKRPEYYAIEGTRYMLVELSNYSVPEQTEDCFRQLGDSGLTPIITHPERNPILQGTPQRVLDWAEQGCVIQVTASALTGAWGERTQRSARWLLEREAVHVLATDAHDTKRRVPILSAGQDAAADICGPVIAEKLTDDNPRSIVEGRPVPYLPKPVRKN
jgi:protein-tyrosine phosphatase